VNKAAEAQAVGWLKDHPGDWSAEDVAEGIGMPNSSRFLFDVLAAQERAGLVESRRVKRARRWQAATVAAERAG
jgi:hypothetical protein